MAQQAKELIQETLQALKGSETKPEGLSCFVGLDGFVDEIIHVVDKRIDFESYTRVETIAQLAERIGRAAGLSTNIELIPKQVKLGGNGPIMANALRSYGAQVTYVGCLGSPDIHQVFRELADACDTYSICEPGHTDALEFTDGKLMLGKIEVLKEVNWENITAKLPPEKMVEILSRSQLISMVNWTMIPYMNDIWETMLDDVLPKLDSPEKPLAFFDLADPEKRSKEDIASAMELIQRFEKYCRVILGLNRKEASEIADVLGLTLSDKPENVSLEEITTAIAERLDLFCLVVHPVTEAGTVVGGQFYHVEGPYTSNPRLTTGAGDNFNAGFCLGQLLGLAPQQCLVTGTGTSGFYVRNMRSPRFSELMDFLELWSENVGQDF
ncbi:MAG: carbohydrate kinase family protein [Firmicutes bacterium]|jgi:sugar/nucleoside kinase (ribokinase family)|nr:carbohydrate kinase family protein [Bacillota bacterium]